jgi:uncharacterized protein (TIGR01619 family)
MAEDWDFYFLTVDGRPASIYVDLGLEAQGPRPSHRWSAYVRLRMNAPRADGLSSEGEYDALIALEDALVGAVTAADAAIYAGRCTVDGRRDFYFFTSDPAAFDAAARTALAPFTGYGGDIGAREDAAWRSYFDFLLPSPRARRRMMNRRVCDVLEQNGDALSAPRPINHAATFPTDAARKAFATHVAEAGYAIEPQGPPQDGAYWICFSAVAAPAEIDPIVDALEDAAARFGGSYDGWGCETRRPSTEH